MIAARKRRTPATTEQSSASSTETEAEPRTPIDHSEPAEGVPTDRSDVEHEHLARQEPGDIEREIERDRGADANDVERDAGPSADSVD